MKPNTEVCMILAVNKIPPILAPKVVKGDVQDNEDDEKIQSKSAQVNLDEAKPKQSEVDPEEIFKKVDLSGTADWDPAEEWDVHNLIHEYVYFFTE